MVVVAMRLGRALSACAAPVCRATCVCRSTRVPVKHVCMARGCGAAGGWHAGGRGHVRACMQRGEWGADKRAKSGVLHHVPLAHCCPWRMLHAASNSSPRQHVKAGVQLAAATQPSPAVQCPAPLPAMLQPRPCACRPRPLPQPRRGWGCLLLLPLPPPVPLAPRRVAHRVHRLCAAADGRCQQVGDVEV